VRVYVFTCMGQPGHRLWSSPARPQPADATGCPNPHKLDTGFCPRTDEGERAQGRAALHWVTWDRHVTVLAFWDRSGDPRPGSHSTFVLDGHHAFEEAVRHAEEAFPHLFARYTFQVRLENCRVCGDRGTVLHEVLRPGGPPAYNDGPCPACRGVERRLGG